MVAVIWLQDKDVGAGGAVGGNHWELSPGQLCDTGTEGAGTPALPRKVSQAPTFDIVNRIKAYSVYKVFPVFVYRLKPK